MRLLLLGLLLLAGCAHREVYQQQRYIFGTLVEVSVYGDDRAKATAAIDRVMQRFGELHRKFHAWALSEITSLNDAFASGRAMRIDPEAAFLIRESTLISDRSGGLFDPAIGGLIALWGFQGDEFRPVRPAPGKIAALVAQHPEMDDISIRGDVAMSKNPAVKLDLGGIAKGYALDVAAGILKASGVSDALVNIGGNILALGRRGDRPWHVGIRDPRGSGAIAELDLQDGEAIGTSGDYQRYFMLNGLRYCHIIDPRTGYPVQGVRAVTVLIPKGKDAGLLSDAASKPLFVSGVAGWRAAARETGVDEAMLIDASGGLHVTRKLSARLHFEPSAPRPEIVP